MTREGQLHDVFVLPVVSPAVPEGLARLRATGIEVHPAFFGVAVTRLEGTQ